MNDVARPWIGLCFKLMAVLAFIFAFIFFMLMNEDQSKYDKLQNHGVVSRALVTAKEKDTVTTHSSGLSRRSRGYTTEHDIWVLSVRHVPKSTVKYADFPSKVKEADLPVAPKLTGDPMKDSGNGGVMWVSEEIYNKTKVGDMLTVVNTPWDSESPVQVTEVEAFDPSPFYPKMAIALFLTLLFWFIGRRISKASMLRGIAAVSTVPGDEPMSVYQPALDQLRERRKGKPGELILLTGVVLMIAAPFALFLVNANGDKLAALKSEGVVAEAIVKDKSVRSESYTDRKGRSKTRDLHALNLQHDINAELKYADWKAGKPFAKSQYPGVTTTSIDVGESYYDALAAGAKTTVVRTPTDYKSMMLTDQLEYETSFAYMMWWYLGTAAAVLAGLAMTIAGWRKRFPRA